jgi:hypothetical protein
MSVREQEKFSELSRAVAFLTYIRQTQDDLYSEAILHNTVDLIPYKKTA